METKLSESKEQQWKDSMSLSSSSRSSSITSESSDGHFDIRHFPLPKPSLSAPEAQKQRESHQAYNSSVSSYTSSSWSSNHLIDLPGYDPNRIPPAVFSSKPGNSMEWSIASNESLFSIHDGNFSISTAALRLAEIPRFEEPCQEITEINLVPLPPSVKKLTEHEKETITENKPNQVEKPVSEIDDKLEEKKMIESESDDEHENNDEEEDMIEAKVTVEIETQKPEEKLVEDVKKNKPAEDSISTVSHSPSISCRSDTSNNSIGSFAFPVLQKEDGVNKTPSVEIRGNVSHKRNPEYMLPQSPPMQPAQPQPQPYLESSTPAQLQQQSQIQRKASRQSESRKQSIKASRNGGWFSCFRFPKCRLFK
ncbi:hypothetical protein EUTSA_v10022338mg [Eutrema salsugineum]|uniref:Uncharacterized protein n=1 Tax=Eutrema salsugineum TaxID=72664 RepID=V4M195_EUTSA|nr:pinin [Eutrema salsugineum]ESQ49899.1 hypothetical protein EUTSA_v10022338mg [Eutrema salsugineum]